MNEGDWRYRADQVTHHCCFVVLSASLPPLLTHRLMTSFFLPVTSNQKAKETANKDSNTRSAELSLVASERCDIISVVVVVVVARLIGNDGYCLKVDDEAGVIHRLNFLRSPLSSNISVLPSFISDCLLTVLLVRPSMLTRRERTRERTLFFLSERTTNRRRRTSFVFFDAKVSSNKYHRPLQIHLHPSVAMIKDE